MKVIICGGQNFLDFLRVWKDLYTFHGEHTITHVIEGGARGVDHMAREWAQQAQIPYTTVPAQWDRYGKSAGYKRNVQMADMNPDAVIAFPGGHGTKMMVDIARERSIAVYHYDY